MYEILFQGVLPPERIGLDYSPERLEIPPKMRAAAALHCDRARGEGRKLVNLPLYRYLGHTQRDGRLDFRLAATDFEEYFGLELAGYAQAPVVLTVAGATIVEGRVVMERRSQQVAQRPGWRHVKPSGHIHPPQTPYQAYLAELEEELGIQEHELREPRFLGLVRSLTANCICVIYRAETSLSMKELTARKPVDAWEADSLMLVEPHEMEGQSEVTGPALATLALETMFRRQELG